MIIPVWFSQAQLTGPYFNLPFPSTTVTRFAPDIFTEELHAPPIFSPDGTEVYWNLMGPGHPHIYYMKLENGIWTEPALAPFIIGDYTDSPFITNDETKLFFLAMNQPLYEENICMVEKLNGEWGTPQVLGNEVNQFNPHWQASVANNQNLYFSGHTNTSSADIYVSEYVNYNYVLAEKLGPEINSENGYEGTPFIAPDESYLIFDRVAAGSNYADLFISFKQNGMWSEAVNMSELNTGAHELYGNVSPNGRFIMFLSGRSGILLPYWVDAQIINNYISDVDNEIKDGDLHSFQLLQNYPNPFNPDTKIPYSINQTSFVTLKVYDVLGNEITTLVNEEKPAGEYEVNFDGSELTSGVYFYQLISNSYIESKNMILMK